MGLAVQTDGVSRIVEYTELPRDIAAAHDAHGHLQHWAGNTGIHVFSRDFLEEIAESGDRLPWHVAHKAVTYLDAAGERIVPAQPNALKFERFIFDVIPRAESALFVEADRASEFNPVKNRFGDDSPQSCQRALVALHRHWLESAGVALQTDTVEVSPSLAIDGDELIGLFPDGYSLHEPTEITRVPGRC
jgi:UDP-N-acetylglucosamine/UDP-N-acetylgalactosamine diphosphorylase